MFLNTKLFRKATDYFKKLHSSQELIYFMWLMVTINFIRKYKAQHEAKPKCKKEGKLVSSKKVMRATSIFSPDKGELVSIFTFETGQN